MTRTKSISFAEVRRLLNKLGFAERRTDAAWVFHHPTEGLLVFRLYGSEDTVEEGDLRSTRKFLDLRGLLEAETFDKFVQEANTPA